MSNQLRRLHPTSNRKLSKRLIDFGIIEGTIDPEEKIIEHQASLCACAFATRRNSHTQDFL